MIVFKRFGRKGYSLFACLGREVIISTLSVATLTYASAESVSVKPVTADTIATKTDREMTLDEVNVMGSRAPMTQPGSENGNCTGTQRHTGCAGAKC